MTQPDNRLDRILRDFMLRTDISDRSERFETELDRTKSCIRELVLSLIPPENPRETLRDFGMLCQPWQLCRAQMVKNIEEFFG